MDTRRADKFFMCAFDYCNKNGMLKEREVKSPETFKKMKCSDFLANYCWVVYLAGFRKKVIEKLFPKLRVAYHEFDLEKIFRMRSIEKVLAIFNNDRKANSFLTGARGIADMGFDVFKRRVLEDWHYLSSLKGIGSVTVHHLAMDIGFDTLKPDLHLTRVSRLLGARDPFELADYLANKFKQKKMVVDAAIFEFCEGQVFSKEHGCHTIEEFILRSC